MQAVVFAGIETMKVEDQGMPELQAPTDALLKVTTAAICGSDLHMYEGRTGLRPGQVVGHEIMGVIESVGDAVASIRPGDRVVLPFNIGCGFCRDCHRGDTNMCLTMNQEKPHAAYGYAGMGPYSGGQAEYVRVPHADFNCLKLPGEPFDAWEDDFILLADVFPTGYHGAVLAQVKPGKSVAVFGAGPVGLMAALSSWIRGAAEVYCVDFIPERLEKARELGAIPVNVRDGDPVEQIRERRKKSSGFTAGLRPGEAGKLSGVDCVIDAVGYQARSHRNYQQESPTQVLEDAVRLANPAGALGIVGVYMAPDPGGRDEAARQGSFVLPLAQIFDKALSIGLGQCPVKRYNEALRDLIVAGRVHPGSIVSHRIPIAQAPDAYRKFDRRSDGYTKVVIRFDQLRAA